MNFKFHKGLFWNFHRSFLAGNNTQGIKPEYQGRSLIGKIDKIQVHKILKHQNKKVKRGKDDGIMVFA